MDVAEELTGSGSKEKWHSGISLVVPADQILDILNQPKLLAYERQIMKKRVEEIQPVETTIRNAENRPKRKNRDVEIPPVSGKKFSNDLRKATKKGPS